MELTGKKKAAGIVDGARNAANRVGRFFWWTGCAATRGTTALVALVPGVAVAAKTVDTLWMVFKGHELSGGVLDNAQNTAEKWANDESWETRLGGAALGTYALSVDVAGGVADLGDKVVGVATHGEEADRWFRAGVDFAVAAGATGLAVAVAKTTPKISRPTPLVPMAAPTSKELAHAG